MKIVEIRSPNGGIIYYDTEERFEMVCLDYYLLDGIA
jgi:hypothetical protein